MKRARFYSQLALLLTCFCFQVAQGQFYFPNLTLEGVTGSKVYGYLEALMPLNLNCNNLWYTDLQAKYGYDNAYYLGLGVGDRFLSKNKIYGGYVFLDYNKTRSGHDYWIASPGLEMLTHCWDVRLNTYFPVSNRRHDEGSFFPSGLNECGIHGDCSFVEFHGHQQFEHRFLNFEEVGIGADLTAGRKFWGCTKVLAGPYYYHLNDTDDIFGAAVRVELPIRNGVAIIAEASYDNDVQGAAVIGLQYRFNANHSCEPLCNRLYEPIYRYRGSINTGAGIKSVHDKKDEGLFLRRDDIFFFSESGTAVLGDPFAGTFENPFADDQFTQDTVTAIGRDTNFYFSTGTYPISPATGSVVTLIDGQSLFGRSLDFKCTVSGDERPILLGSINIVNTADHTLDSLQILNLQSNSGATVFGLNLTGARNVHICNTNIVAENKVTGDSDTTTSNAAIGIVANDSDVIIDNSTITGRAIILGSNFGANAGVGIGNFNDAFVGNHFSIRHSTITGLAQVGVDNVGGINGTMNLATGIGLGIARRLSITGDTTNFQLNEFSLLNSTVIANAVIGNDNLSGTQTLNVQGGFNQATGIGNNVSAARTIPTSTANFLDNIFVLDKTDVFSTAQVGRDNSTILTLNDIAVNAATGIGNNVSALNSDLTADFTGNDFTLCCNRTLSNAIVGRDNTVTSDSADSTTSSVNNLSAGIGNNTAELSQLQVTPQVSANFVGNVFSLNNVEVLANSSIGNDNIAVTDTFHVAVNLAAGIGNNGGAIARTAVIANFANNDFTLSQTQVSGLALIGNDNIANGSLTSASNLATGIGNNSMAFFLIGEPSAVNFLNNNFTLTESKLVATAAIEHDSRAETNAVVSNMVAGIGNNLATLSAVDKNTNFTNNLFILTDNLIQSIAKIGNDNIAEGVTSSAAFNHAAGIGNNTAFFSSARVSAVFTNNDFTICGTQVSATAEIGDDNISTSATRVGLNLATAIGINSIPVASSNTAATFDFNEFNISCSSLLARAIVDGDQTIFGSNIAVGVNADGTGNRIAISRTIVDVLAQIKGNNSGANTAIGLTAVGTDTLIQITDSIVNVFALSNGTNTAISFRGNVVATNTTFNVTP